MSQTHNAPKADSAPSSQFLDPLRQGVGPTRFGNGFNTRAQHWGNQPLHQRPRSPGLKWHKEYDTPESLTCGRVLLIDYVKQDHSKEGMRKVAAQEISSIEALRKFYSNQDRGGEAVLRVIHVQNAPWAVQFLLLKFNITSKNDLVGTDFGQFVKHKQSQRHGGKPLVNGKTWDTTHDPWRRISRTSFGIDYLKNYKASGNAPRSDSDSPGKMMELNCYDNEDNPTYGWDVYVQRLCCYIQHRENSMEVPASPNIENPYNQGDGYVPRVQNLDNGNTIIIFENSFTGSIEDTLISARQQWESRWRRLPFYLAYEAHDVSNDDLMAMECMKLILQDVWKSVADSWEVLLDCCTHHVSILEDKIYEGPADETRAPELWTNSSMWLKLERLVSIHTAVVKETQSNLRELTGELAVEDNWLESITGDMERLSTLVQEDLVKPTSSLADLMYKSVEIRDSRHSLQLNTSLWRLSWITFIFLPLTFIVGFFGMNVDTFANNPSIKWYFVAAVPMMLLVLIFWYIIKHFLARRRQTPYQRGIYENLFHELATIYPNLWSRSGPRDVIRPQSMMDRFKWRLILYWNMPGKTIKAGPVDEDSEFDGLGAWARMKRSLTRRWTSQIRSIGRSNLNASATTLEEGGDFNVVSSGIGEVTELLALPATEHAQNLPGGMLKVSLPPASFIRSSRSGSAERPSSRDTSGTKRNSGVMVEEERTTWLQELGEKSLRLNDWIGVQGSARSEHRSDGKRPSSSASAPERDNGHRDNTADEREA
ncbi:hypothetical protein MMC07_001398 [Pseudocyphellaria aurata]|nr:hypothetical protein [Pseudocyphellaria aurata]